MNTVQPPYDMHHPHMAQPHTSGPPNHGHYSHYPQPPMMQGAQGYSSAPSAYSYSYGGSINQAPPHPAPPGMANPMLQPLPAMSAGAPPGLQGNHGYSNAAMDTTGQIAPPGMKPRVTATLWEDEGSLCFQVEAKGICVARREDNHMINGTKLLNVAGMTRGRRDGILKSEKVRHVVKIGPMHLKGVWIPYERALDFANKEKITEQLYPLFVHDIGALLYHPSNNQNNKSGQSSSMSNVDRSRLAANSRYMPNQTPQPPSLHHHHSMSNPMNPAPAPGAIQQHPGAGRPGIDRAHTFPTPPTSASSVMGMGAQYGSGDWNSSGVSVPNTPATTPPGNAVGGVQYPTSQGYDTSRSIYTAPPTQTSPYGSQVRYGQYPKTDMAPPARTGDEHDAKHDLIPAAPQGEVEEHDSGDYTHTNAPYSGPRDAFSHQPTYPAAYAQNPSDPLSSSPSHQTGSGRATPRTSGVNNYGGPQRSTSYLHNVMGDSHGASPAVNGTPEVAYAQTPYQAPYTNGASSNKRARDDDDDYRPDSRSDSVNEVKRRKTAPMGGAVGSPYDKSRSGAQAAR